MILVIDNYDSFTYNLVQYLGELNPDIRVFKNDEISVADIEIKSPSHIVISPGPGTPERAGISVDVVRTFADKIPILGICLGHQAIARAFGVKLEHAPKLFHGKTSEIRHNNRGVLQGLPSPMEVMRYHSWIIGSLQVEGELEVTATTDDDVPMAIQHKKFPVFGLQFHPESILTKHGKHIIKNFLDDYQP